MTRDVYDCAAVEMKSDLSRPQVSSRTVTARRHTRRQRSAPSTETATSAMSCLTRRCHKEGLRYCVKLGPPSRNPPRRCERFGEYVKFFATQEA